jgi:hypothetical protein
VETGGTIVSLKLSHEESFGPLQVDDAVGVTNGPVQFIVGLLSETVPVAGVAAGDAAVSKMTNKERMQTLSQQLLQRDAFIVFTSR